MPKVFYAAASYLLFVFSFAWAFAFLGDVWVPKTIDSGPVGTLPVAVAVDLVLVTIFSLQHSVMARPGFKQVWTRFVDPSLERATYVLLSSICLIALLAFWQPIAGTVWNPESSVARTALWVGNVIGWAVVGVSTALIDHLHLFGLKQSWWALKGEAQREPTFRRVLFYRLVRHPIMLGFLIVFWVTPTMSFGHLLFSAAMTAYIFVGVHFEERDLRAALGDTYRAYEREVRGLLPLPKRRS